MDTSEIYIKMSDCPEIQALRQWEYYDNDKRQVTREGNYAAGDVVCADGKVLILGHTPYLPKEYSWRGLDISMVGYDEGDSLGGVTKLIWLPHQDQLQEMVGGFNLLKFWQGFFSYSDYVVQTEIGFELPRWASPCVSWQQLWLSFVMNEKFSKKWTGETWESNA